MGARAAWPLRRLVFPVTLSGYCASCFVSSDVQLFFPLNTQHVFHFVFSIFFFVFCFFSLPAWPEWNFNQRPLHSSQTEKVSKNNTAQLKGRTALRQRRWRRRENYLSRRAGDACVQVSGRGGGGGKLIAFCHKHSLINMITFAYFILLLICCLTYFDCKPSNAPVPRGKIFITAQTWKVFRVGFWGGAGGVSLGTLTPARPLRTCCPQNTSAGLCVDGEDNDLETFEPCKKQNKKKTSGSMIWVNVCGAGCVQVSCWLFCASLTYQ